ncbi:glycerol-3-phosphate acyltransferase [Granulicatella balaenopterae]|nr:glycerol-3-phosphate acyltransferase [Granulicatella balaenopterae]
MMLALDWRMGLLGIIVLILASFIINYIAIGALVLWLSFLVMTDIYFGLTIPVAIVLALYSLVLMLHKENIKRIKTGEEVTVRSAFNR